VGQRDGGARVERQRTGAEIEVRARSDRVAPLLHLAHVASITGAQRARRGGRHRRRGRDDHRGGGRLGPGPPGTQRGEEDDQSDGAHPTRNDRSKCRALTTKAPREPAGGNLARADTVGCYCTLPAPNSTKAIFHRSPVGAAIFPAPDREIRWQACRSAGHSACSTTVVRRAASAASVVTRTRARGETS